MEINTKEPKAVLCCSLSLGLLTQRLYGSHETRGGTRYRHIVCM